MEKRAYIYLLLLALFFTGEAQARLYRWVDEHGNVQYTGSPPPGDAKSVTEFDQRGIVRKAASKAASAGEIAQKEAEQQALLVQRRRDQSLLQSFSRPEEIDFLRDRQIDAVAARLQTNKLRRQGVEDKIKRLSAQADNFTRRKKPVPDAISADLESSRKEIADLDIEAQKMAAEIAVIKERAEADKMRLLELRGSTPLAASKPAGR